MSTRIEWTGNIQVHHPVKEADPWGKVLGIIEAECPRREEDAATVPKLQWYHAQVAPVREGRRRAA